MPGRTSEDYLSEIAALKAEGASLKATTRAQAVEIRDLKKAVDAVVEKMDAAAEKNAEALTAMTAAFHSLQLQVTPMLKSAEKLDRLLTEADRQDGMKTLASKLVGGGVIGTVLTALAGIFYYFKGGM